MAAPMLRTLGGALRPHVNARTRARGEAYLRQGRVTVIHTGTGSVSARVRGSVPYEVSLTIDGHVLRPACDCPYFEGLQEPCKHVWALALLADRQRLIDVPPELEVEHGDHDIEPFESSELADISSARLAIARAARRSGRAGSQAWQQFLAAVPAAGHATTLPATTGELLYVFDPVRSANTLGLHIELLRRQRKKNGEWAKPRDASIMRNDIRSLPDEADREILERVCGAANAWSAAWNVGYSLPVPSPFVLTPILQRDLIERLCATGRFWLRPVGSDGDPADLLPLRWDGDPAVFRLVIDGTAAGGYTVTGVLDQAGQAHPLGDALFVTRTVVLWRPIGDDVARLSPFDASGADRWLAALLNAGTVEIPPAGATPLLETLASSGATRVTAPADLHVETRDAAPTPIARIRRPRGRATPWSPMRLHVTVAFAYGPQEIGADSPQPLVFDRTSRVAWRRDRAAESAALARLDALGARPLTEMVPSSQAFEPPVAIAGRYDLAESGLTSVVRALVTEGWRVEAEGRVYRRPGASTLGVRSGIDWFELRGSVDYDGVAASLPAVLSAARRGEAFVTLDDGSLGLLPDEWLARSLRMTAIGDIDGDHVRFQPSQAALIDAWLAEQPAVTWDEPFARLRDTLAGSLDITPLDAPPSFTGELRDYQRDGARLVRLPAAVRLRRLPGRRHGPRQDRAGAGRARCAAPAARTRRRAAPAVARRRAALARLQLARGGRALRAGPAGARRVRRAATGAARGRRRSRRRPDHLRHAAARRRAPPADRVRLRDPRRGAGDQERRHVGREGRAAAAGAAPPGAHRHAGREPPRRALEPVRVPQPRHARRRDGLHRCAHDRARRRRGDARDPGARPASLHPAPHEGAGRLRAAGAHRADALLRSRARPAQACTTSCAPTTAASLLGKVDRDGLGRSTMHVLEALLRLRQAACHPGLVDDAHAHGPSAKLDILVPRLEELVEEGHKALVFSQFTSLLALLRRGSTRQDIPYEYLDGRTRDREARVDGVPGRARLPLFLISLKAGGLGLNLTAADYVFLLDPWWNPAVEAQAIDRAHRIGQTRAVFAYRLIARDTVEEKVLELQAGKRELAEAIVRADASLLRDLKREDLELLLS